MRSSFLFIPIVLLCFSCINSNDLSVVSSPENNSNLNTDIDLSEFLVEYYTDSLNFGIQGESMFELKRYNGPDSSFYILNLFKKEEGNWRFVQQISEKIDDVSNQFHPEIKDFNNDGFNDLTFVSMTAARGGNEIRKLVLFDKENYHLIPIKNSEFYPNIRYNKELDCIDAFLIHGMQTTVFAKIQGDSLVQFASVENTLDSHIITLYDKDEQEIQSWKEKSEGFFLRFKNFRPLDELEDIEN